MKDNIEDNTGKRCLKHHSILCKVCTLVNRAKALKRHNLQAVQLHNHADNPDSSEGDPYNHVGDPVNYASNPSELKFTSHHLSGNILHLSKEKVTDKADSNSFDEPSIGTAKQLPQRQSKRKAKRKHNKSSKGFTTCK